MNTTITTERAEILQSLADRVATILKFVELERAGIHAEIIPGKHPIENALLISELGEQIATLAGKLGINIFREEHPAEYARLQSERRAERERRFEQWHNNRPGDEGFLFLEDTEIDAILAERAELVAKGMLRDSGRRRDEEVVWEITETGKAYVEILESLRD